MVDRYGDSSHTRAFVEAVLSFVFIKFPRSIWSAIAEKLATCPCGFIISYTIMVAGIVVFSLVSAFSASVNSHTRNAFIGYGFVLLTDYEPFSTYLLFGWYHRKIMLSGHFGHWQGCIFGHICDSAMDRRVQILRQPTRSISLPDSVVTV